MIGGGSWIILPNIDVPILMYRLDSKAIPCHTVAAFCWRVGATMLLAGHKRSVLVGVVLLGVLGVESAAAAALETSRRAVVIAITSFAGERLPTAEADGRLIANTLQEADFDVLLIQDPESKNLSETSQKIEEHVNGSEVALLYYTGVGALRDNDVVLQPSDAVPSSKGKPEALTVGSLTKTLRKGAGAAILVLDGIPAPLITGERLTRSVSPLRSGVAGGSAVDGVILSYSGAVTAPWVSGSTGANGIFATVFANAISQRGVSLQQMFREIRRNVREVTRGTQVPHTAGDVALDLVLRPEVEDPIASLQRPSLDQILWTLIKDSADPADFSLFQETFPSSLLVERVVARRIALSSGKAESVGTLTVTSGSASDAQERDAGRLQSLAFGVSVDRAPPVQVRTWPSVLPDTPNGLATLSTRCDEVAGDPDDPMRLSPGIQWGLVNMRLAARTCLLELVRDPDNRRLMYQVGRILDMLKLYTWAESYYRDAARLGYSAGYAKLAYLHMTGRGRPVDMAAALPYLKAGAELGDPRCRTDLGFAYLKGYGVERSTDEALLWLRLAAASGWPNAMDILANMYLEGIGVEEDPKAAIELFQASAWVGNTNAMSSMGRRFSEGRGVKRDPAMARIWYERAIAAGNAFAPLYLGQMYRDGDGVRKNTARALELMMLSAERGFGEARLRIAELYEKGRGVSRDLEAAAFNYMLTDYQSFEHPVQPEFMQQAKERLTVVMAKLSDRQSAAVRRRVDEYIKLNGLPGR
ncbi:hypothetical protein CDO26_19985 (plasmid) [Sinorhizobium meliloti]|nr:hypothetical protein CDO26_19985 [Sinorhizobium meliloti]